MLLGTTTKNHKQVLMLEACRPYHHKFTRAASRDWPPMIVKYYNHSYTLLPERIYPV